MAFSRSLFPRRHRFIFCAMTARFRSLWSAALSLALLLPAPMRAVASPSSAPSAPPTLRAIHETDQEELRRLMPDFPVLPSRIQRDAAEARRLAGGPSSLPTVVTPDAWLELPPPMRYGAIGMYDSTGDRLLICGG